MLVYGFLLFLCGFGFYSELRKIIGREKGIVVTFYQFEKKIWHCKLVQE
jgi:hypothetical protein